jgi:hypothetical protein
VSASDRDSARRNMVFATQVLEGVKCVLDGRLLECGTRAEIESRVHRLGLLFRQYSDAQTERRGEAIDTFRACNGASTSDVLPTLLKDEPIRAAREVPIPQWTLQDKDARSDTPKAVNGPTLNGCGLRSRPRQPLSLTFGFVRFIRWREIGTRAGLLLDKFSTWLMTRV